MDRGRSRFAPFGSLLRAEDAADQLGCGLVREEVCGCCVRARASSFGDV